MKEVEIFTDGACSGNPGPGGFGAILKYKGVEKEICGGEAHTTNNRMEMTAVITALEMLKEPCKVTLYSDSKYVIDSVTKGWAKSWQSKGWVKNKHKVEFVWVKGHAGHPENERCDRLAVEQSQKFKAE